MLFQDVKRFFLQRCLIGLVFLCVIESWFVGMGFIFYQMLCFVVLLDVRFYILLDVMFYLLLDVRFYILFDVRFYILLDVGFYFLLDVRFYVLLDVRFYFLLDVGFFILLDVRIFWFYDELVFGLFSSVLIWFQLWENNLCEFFNLFLGQGFSFRGFFGGFCKLVIVVLEIGFSVFLECFFGV